jgi:uncharacterized protein (TIGR02599 family)
MMKPPIPPRAAPAFTLVEVLVSTAVVALLTVLMVSLASETTRTLSFTTAKSEQFRAARDGFESMTQRLSQATLNTYWDYEFSGTGPAPTPNRYNRRSELRFVSAPVDTEGFLGQPAEPTSKRLTHAVFFTAPMGYTEVQGTDATSQSFKGLENLLNVVGYYVEFGNDLPYRPSFLEAELAPMRWRFRLLMFMPPTEEMRIYNFTSGWINPALAQKRSRSADYRGMDWFSLQANQADPPVRVVAENIIALILTPRLSKQEEKSFAQVSDNPDESPLAPDYVYDSSPRGVSGTGRPLIPVGDDRYKDGRLNPVAQLPPVMQVTMIAIDETSALKLQLGEGDEDKFGLGPGSQKFRAAKDYSKDLRLDPNEAYGKPNTQTGESADEDGPLENTLVGARVAYRVFTTNIAMRGSKWSRALTE